MFLSKLEGLINEEKFFVGVNTAHSINEKWLLYRMSGGQSNEANAYRFSQRQRVS